MTSPPRRSNGLWHHCSCVYWLKRWQPSGSWNKIQSNQALLNSISSCHWLAGCSVTWLLLKQFDANEIWSYWCLIKSDHECVCTHTHTCKYKQICIHYAYIIFICSLTKHAYRIYCTHKHIPILWLCHYATHEQKTPRWVKNRSGMMVEKAGERIKNRMRSSTSQ